MSAETYLTIIEIIGFSIAVLEIYFPQKASIVESWADEFSRVKILVPTWNQSYRNAFVLLFVIGVVIGWFVAVAMIIYDFCCMDFEPGGVGWTTFTKIVFLFLVALLAALPIAIYVFHVIAYIFASLLKLFVVLANWIHPSEYALCGAGFIIALIGLLAKLVV